MGYLHFYSIRREETIVYDMKFSSPMGYLHFYSRYVRFGEIPPEESSRPLWGIYISIQTTVDGLTKLIEFSSPMGYLHFYSILQMEREKDIKMFSSPMGYLHFYSRM